MSEMITVEAVTTKFANKFSSGSVLSNGKWLQVAKSVDIGNFQKDSQINVELKTNEKGYTSIVGLAGAMPPIDSPKKAVETAKKEIKKALDKSASSSVSSNGALSYENKDRRILVQGIVQSVTHAPAIAGLPFTNVNEFVANVKAASEQLIEYVLERSK